MTYTVNNHHIYCRCKECYLNSPPPSFHHQIKPYILLPLSLEEIVKRYKIRVGEEGWWSKIKLSLSLLKERFSKVRYYDEYLDNK